MFIISHIYIDTWKKVHKFWCITATMRPFICMHGVPSVAGRPSGLFDRCFLDFYLKCKFNFEQDFYNAIFNKKLFSLFSLKNFLHTFNVGSGSGYWNQIRTQRSLKTGIETGSRQNTRFDRIRNPAYEQFRQQPMW